MNFLLLSKRVYKIAIIPFSILCSFNYGYSQNNQFFGQKTPSTTPKVFASENISKQNQSEFGSVFSSDGTEFFYAVDINGKAEIKYSKLKEGTWSAPLTILTHKSYSYNDPMLSPDQERLYYISNKPKNGTTTGDYDIWYSKRLAKGWSKPINAGENINSSKNEYYVSFTADGTMYFSSNKNAEKERQFDYDIYFSKFENGEFQKPVRLSEQINTPNYEADVFIASNESYIIFCSTRKNGFGRGDLYISHRKKNGEWSEANILNETINTKNHELCPWVTNDGKYLFYTSNQDIYWVNTKALRFNEFSNNPVKNSELLNDLKIPQLISKGKVAGIQIAVVEENNKIRTQGFGFKNYKDLGKVDSLTIFEAASLTKPVFGYLVMKMVQEELLNLDKSVLEYLSLEEIEAFFGHSINTKGFRKDWAYKITARHLLSHSGGMPHGEGGDVFPILFEPGSKFRYSAAGYDLLQRVIEKIKGEKLNILADNYIFNPLKMKNSSLVWRKDYQQKTAQGHDMFGNPKSIRKYTIPNAMASLYTTAYDYALFVNAIMNETNLPNNLIKEYLNPQITVDEERALFWALGFGIQKDGNNNAFWQWGDYGIFKNYIIAYPNEKKAVIYLSNSYNGLGISKEIVQKTISANTKGIDYLGYVQYDSPLGKFCWSVMDNGVNAITSQLPKLKQKHPEQFDSYSIRWLASQFIGEERYEEGIALLKFNINQAPNSIMENVELARAYLTMGDLNNAEIYFTKIRELGKDDDNFDESLLHFAMSYIQAIKNPVKVTSNHLMKLAGSYEDRHFEIRGNDLYYSRGSKDPANFTKLIPITKNIFAIENSFDFRVEFELEKGNKKASKVIGLYESGFKDQSLRNNN